MRDIKRRVYELAKKHKSAVNVEILADTLFYRLTIIRLGEEDNNMWWESCILGEVGRRNLEKFFPNTFYKQRYDIARKIIAEKENREIPEKRFITLFNFGYEFESKIFTPFINEVTNSDGWQEVLDMIENIKEKKFTSPWAREFFNLPKLPVYTLNDKNAIELGSISETFYRNKESFDDTIKSFISIYDLCTIGRVVIPYYKRRMAI